MSLHQNKEWLYQKYITEKKDCVRIGKIVSRDPGTIHYWLKKFNIPSRPRGHNWQTNLNQGRGFGWHHTQEAKDKVGKASRDRKAVPYRNSKNGEHWLKNRPSENNPNWKGGITPERQNVQRSKEWKEAIKAVWQRDNAICQRCKLDHRTLNRTSEHYKKFHIHHIVSFEIVELRTKVDNLILFCRPCHLWVHSKKNINKDFIKEI